MKIEKVNKLTAIYSLSMKKISNFISDFILIYMFIGLVYLMIAGCYVAIGITIGVLNGLHWDSSSSGDGRTGEQICKDVRNYKPDSIIFIPVTAPLNLGHRMGCYVVDPKYKKDARPNTP